MEQILSLVDPADESQINGTCHMVPERMGDGRAPKNVSVDAGGQQLMTVRIASRQMYSTSPTQGLILFNNEKREGLRKPPTSSVACHAPSSKTPASRTSGGNEHRAALQLRGPVNNTARHLADRVMRLIDKGELRSVPKSERPHDHVFSAKPKWRSLVLPTAFRNTLQMLQRFDTPFPQLAFEDQFSSTVVLHQGAFPAIVIALAAPLCVNNARLLRNE